ncbi:MAG: GNAT family N-acetyltransferase [Microthrixaceae bacterium]
MNGTDAEVCGPGTDRELEAVLARAFADDPIWQWLLPRPSSYDRRARALLGSLARMYRDAGGEVWRTAGGAAFAIWGRPGSTPLGPARALPVLHRLLPAILPTAPRFATLSAFDHHHPHEEHWYLAVLGTDPAHQRRGHGAAAIAPVLERADAEGRGCYLESSKEANVPFYRGRGFEVLRTLEVGRGAPPVWLMWRDPR